MQATQCASWATANEMNRIFPGIILDLMGKFISAWSQFLIWLDHWAEMVNHYTDSSLFNLQSLSQWKIRKKVPAPHVISDTSFVLCRISLILSPLMFSCLTFVGRKKDNGLTSAAFCILLELLDVNEKDCKSGGLLKHVEQWFALLIVNYTYIAALAEV